MIRRNIGLAAAGLLGVAAPTGCSPGDDKAGPAASPVKTTSRDLAAAFEADPAGAQQRFAAGVEVIGTLRGKSLDFRGQPIVELDGNQDFRNVVVHLQSDSSILSSLQLGQPTRARCRRATPGHFSPKLLECSLL